MKAVDTKLLTFLKKSEQLTVPIFQRVYTWGEYQCQQFWNDIIRSGELGITHFIGSILYIDPEFSPISNKSYSVIDGQQRLTTVFLILEALARKLNGQEELQGDFSTIKIRANYLLNEHDKNKRHYKLLLTETDESTLISILEQEDLPEDESNRLIQNFNFFINQIDGLTSNEEMNNLCAGLSQLMIIDTALDPRYDNPQLIFESMNSTGKALSQADLIRNYVIMQKKIQDEQDSLYSNYWRPMEKEFGQKNYDEYFDSFVRHYLTVRMNEIPNINEVYNKFKLHAQKYASDDQWVDNLVKDIRQFSSYYCTIAFDREKNADLKAAFKSLRGLKMDTAYPFLLHVYADYKDEKISSSDFVGVVRLIENYIFRRSVLGLPPNSLNKTFPALIKSISTNHLSSLESYLVSLPTKRRFPRDGEFSTGLMSQDLYKFGYRSYFFDKLENDGRNEIEDTNQYTIEHIMPQELSDEWKKELGDNWKQVHEDLLHTLGNLTLTGYNSTYSNRLFSEKCDMNNGLKSSPLRLNQTLRDVNEWNEEKIKERASSLASRAVTIWDFPHNATVVTLDEQTNDSYSLEDHEYLNRDDIRGLFDALSAEILALDPMITLEPLRRYIAFKAVKNFVDITPLATSLKLILNMNFHELRDPKGMAKDVTNLGRWGNGDVEITLKSVDDIPYVMGLISQSFEQQI